MDAPIVSRPIHSSEKSPSLSNSSVLKFVFGEMGYATYMLPGMVCLEKPQPYVNHGFACSRPLSCVTMSKYAGAL